MPLLSDVFVIFLSSIVVLTPNGQFFRLLPYCSQGAVFPYFHIISGMKYFYCWALSCDDVRQLLSDKQLLCVTRLIRCWQGGSRVRVTFRREILCRVLLRRHFGSERYVVELDF